MILHEPNEDGPDRSMHFWEVISERLIENRKCIKNICFSDEHTFFLNGIVNRQNVRFWSDINPQIF